MDSAMDSTMPPTIPPHWRPRLRSPWCHQLPPSSAGPLRLWHHGCGSPAMASIDPLAPLHNYTQTRSSVNVPLDATSCKFADVNPRVLLFPSVVPYGFLRPLWQRRASAEPTQTGFWFDLVCSSAAGGRHVSTPVPLTPKSLAQSSSLTESPEGKNRWVKDIWHANIQFLVYISGKSDI